MRDAFVRALVEEARSNPELYLLSGDLGFHVLDPWRNELPERFINVGVAEQNLAGMAAGMAMAGKVAVIYSIGNFPTLRCIEQIRNDICYHEANVKVVAVGAGFAYGSLGSTHHATEDIAMMRALPGMIVLSPGDPYEAGEATRAAMRLPGPCYLRIGKSGEPMVHKNAPPFTVGKAITARPGSDLTLVATGGMLVAAMEAAEQLASHALSVRVLSMHTIKPLDEEALLAAASETGKVVTVEEHSLIGGLGSAVAEFLSEAAPGVLLRKLGVSDRFFSRAGSPDHLRAQCGLSTAGIVTEALKLMQRKKLNGVTHVHSTVR